MYIHIKSAYIYSSYAATRRDTYTVYVYIYIIYIYIYILYIYIHIYISTHACIHIYLYTCIYIIYIYTYMFIRGIYRHMTSCIHILNIVLLPFTMGWLWVVGSIKLQVSFAKEPYRRDYIVQKRPIILSILLTVATTYRF